ncbi:MAG: glycosyltransferase family 10 [Candidatus Parcubacteria bacterium]|nr:glycosyltransferase family 10 [Candidatus Parcubacteria bacterium]
MKKILLQVPSIHLANNRIFETDTNNATIPWIKLKERLHSLGYDLTTADNHPLKDVEWIFYLDARSFDGVYIKRGGVKALIKSLFGIKTRRLWPYRSLYQEIKEVGLEDKIVLFQWECKAINPHNYDPAILSKFKYVFAWNDDVVDNKKFFKFYLPVAQKDFPRYASAFNEKKLLANMSMNKRSSQPNELYTARRKTIEYFNNKYPNDFDLYGYIDNPQTKLQKIFSWFNKKYETNRGSVRNKIETLSRYKFTVCYENMKNVKGYVTEKIFDVLVARSVPIYWGAQNIEEFVDADTFIDRRKFKNNEELANYLFSITEEKYNEYLAAGERYLQSEKFKKFLPENFIKTILQILPIEKC